MYDVHAARHDDSAYQRSMAGLAGSGSFLSPSAAEHAPQPRVLAAASSNLQPVVVKASRHDESQTTPRQRVAHACGGPQHAAPGQLDRQHVPKGGLGVVNIHATAAAGLPAQADMPASARGGQYGTGAGSAPQQHLRKGHGGGPLHTAADLLSSLTAGRMPNTARGPAEPQAQASPRAGVSAPRPLQLPPMFSRDPQPTGRNNYQSPSSRQPMTTRVAPASNSPYLAPVPGYNAARQAAAAAPAAAPAPAAGQALPAGRAGVAIPPLGSAPLAAAQQQAAVPAPQTARTNKTNIYMRMSQGLPAVETPRSARAQQLLRQPGAYAPAGSQPPQHQQQQWLSGATNGHGSQHPIPMDAATSSTGLTPRTARLMQRMPAAAAHQPRAAGHTQQQPQLPPSQHTGQPVHPGLQQYHGHPVLPFVHNPQQQPAPVQPQPQPSYHPFALPSHMAAEPAQPPKYNPFGGKQEAGAIQQDVEMETIKAVHASAEPAIGLAAAQQFLDASSAVPAYAPASGEASGAWRPFQAPGAGLQSVGGVSGAAQTGMGLPEFLPQLADGLSALPAESAAEGLTYDAHLQGSAGSGVLTSALRPHQPIPPSSMLSADLSPAGSFHSMHSMPQLYHPPPEQQAPAALHVSHSAEVHASAAAAEAVMQQAAAAPATAAYAPTSRRPSYQDEPAPAVQAAAAVAAAGSRPGTAPGQAPSRATPTRPGVPGPHALRQYEALLTPFEQSEVLASPEVWFAGRASARKIHADKSSPEPNFGFDDSRGDYLTVVGDHIAYRYEVQEVLGRGSFGQVLRCLDHATGRGVALKIIRNKRRFQKQAQIEAAVLQQLQDADPHDSVHIVRAYSSFTFRNHLCITFELLNLNLYEYIKACNFQGSTLTVIRRVAHQVLLCLQFLLQQSIVHCDLKPENILLVERGRTAVKVIDFGSSCYIDQRMYTYIQSRFYRSPEVILGLPYGPPIDMWSLGCILAELLTGQPLLPGEDEKEQLACIMEVLGPPPPQLLQGAPRAGIFFHAGTGAPLPCPPNSRGKTHRPGAQSLESALRGCSDHAFIDFLRGCLQWDPAQRMTPSQALQHEWITRGAGRTPPPALSRLGSAHSGGLHRHPSKLSASSALPTHRVAAK